MKERPILFSGPMVKAILDGRKFQTRRVVNPQPPEYIDRLHGHELSRRAPYTIEHPETGADWGWGFQDDNDTPYRCPYGKPGDRLWVREKFQPFVSEEAMNACHEPDWDKLDYETGEGYQINYPATDGVQEYLDYDNGLSAACKPSIHMPRWASRLTLEVTEVRVERVQDIGLEDARAEGMDDDFREQFDCGHPDCDAKDNWHYGPTWQFARLWDSINGKKHPWASNPWCWAITFKRVEQT